MRGELSMLHNLAPLDYDEPPAQASDEVTQSYALGLPPPQFRLPQFRTAAGLAENRVETPLDKWGLVDVDELVQRVNGTMVPGYRWSGPNDRHHLGWTHAKYIEADALAGDNLATSFRDLSINLIWVPREFHNWTHAVTKDPPVPSRDVMAEYIDEWAMLSGFFKSVKDAIATMRLYERVRQARAGTVRELTDAQEQLLSNDLLRRFGGVAMHVNALDGVTLERWPLSRDMRIHTAAGQIGDIVMRGWRRRTRDVQRPLAGLPNVA